MEPLIQTWFWFAENPEEYGLGGPLQQDWGSHSSNLLPETPQHLKEEESGSTKKYWRKNGKICSFDMDIIFSLKTLKLQNHVNALNATGLHT